MPTDLSALSARKRVAQAQTQAEISLLLVWSIIGLVMFLLLFIDQSFAKATIEWMPFLIQGSTLPHELRRFGMKQDEGLL
jgi:hypothetical protein